jgi:hypothetical protein
MKLVHYRISASAATTRLLIVPVQDMAARSTGGRRDKCSHGQDAHCCRATRNGCRNRTKTASATSSDVTDYDQAKPPSVSALLVFFRTNWLVWASSICFGVSYNQWCGTCRSVSSASCPDHESILIQLSSKPARLHCSH